jgi:hypothetical protein
MSTDKEVSEPKEKPKRIRWKSRKPPILQGYFAVEIETLRATRWTFYKSVSAAHARGQAEHVHDCYQVKRVIMITQEQYENGLHNARILELRNMSPKERARRIKLDEEMQRRKERIKERGGLMKKKEEA